MTAVNYHQNPPSDFQEMLDIWRSVRSAFPEKDATYIDNALATGSWAWKPEIDSCSPAEIDRLGDVLLGPVFSSDAHPWPEEDDSPMIPLLQLNLETASELGGLAFDPGLLQVFVGIEDHLGQSVYTRLVPRVDVRREVLSAPPAFSVSGRVFASIDWATSESDSVTCIQITGYGDKEFTFSGISPLAQQFDIRSFSSEIQAKLNRFDELVEQHIGDWGAGGFHLLGTFYPIQYRQEERSWPLFCLESEHGFNFGDGQAQVFFDDSYPSGTLFSFEWSCY